MCVHVVSDIHGRTDALARAGAGADVLICLGDLVLYVDYHDHSAGIMADLFGAVAVTRLIELRTARRFDEARTWSLGLWAHFDADPRVVLEDAIRRQYAEMFAVLPTPTFITYGNVDVPALWPEFARPGVHVLDGEVAEIGGLRVGFVGGGLQSPMRTPCELSEDDYAAKAAAVGAVDVLCCHIPPAVPELPYDTEARRLEGEAARCWRPSGTPRPGWCCLGTSTSRGRPGPGSPDRVR